MLAPISNFMIHLIEFLARFKQIPWNMKKMYTTNMQDVDRDELTA